MPADDANGWRRGGGFEGFHSYADDTPRKEDDDLRLADREAAPAPAPARAVGWRPLIAGVAVAVALGAGALLALGDSPPDAEEVRAGARLPVEVAEVEPPQPPPVSEATPLEVLPDADARETVDLVPDVAPPSPPVRTKPSAPAEPEPEAPRGAAPELALAAPPRDAVAVAPPPRRDPCAGAPSLAAEMVCRDPELAAADRRMRRAYDDALASGAPEEMLALEQADWRDIREIAARRSRRAVASIYRQRTDELRAMADGAWR